MKFQKTYQNYFFLKNIQKHFKILINIHVFFHSITKKINYNGFSQKLNKVFIMFCLKIE